MFDFWQVHDNVNGLILLLGLFFFPRITFLFAVLTPFGLLHWLGWVFAPRILAAIIATQMYWPTNRVLVILAWIFALGATGGTGSTAASQTRRKKE